MTEIGDKPKLGSSEWLESMNRQEDALKERKANKPQRVDERLDLDATDSEDRVRRARHPAGHIRTGAPVGTSTVGESSRGKDPGR